MIAAAVAALVFAIVAFIALTVVMHWMAPYYAAMSDEEFDRAMTDWYCAMNRYPWSNF